jgi:nicotinate-nucleotide--dimethylbenzimidazole phosphoribosyltransferase
MTVSRPDWLEVPCATPDAAARDRALARQGRLTKPPGSLGVLESVAVRLAGLQGSERPDADRVRIVVFAGDHGVTAEGVSAFPQAVTLEMVRNFARGGAAINVLARALGADLEVLNLGTAGDPGPLDGVLDARLGPGTANLADGAAMDERQVIRALHVGRHAAERAKLASARLFIGGEMGIGNTTAAAALACALLGRAPQELAGPGTGLDAAGVGRKAAVIARALALHAPYLDGPLEALRRLGGFEIAGLAGAFIACGQMGLPVLVDGFIAGTAALVACHLRPGLGEWLLFGHASAEPGHAAVLAGLEAEPLLRLGMRLGEGSGAAVAVPLLRLACALHNDMATFAEANVSEKGA